VDEVAVELACRGERVHLTAAERAEALRRLYSAGLGSGTIACRLGMSAADVREILAGLAAAVPFLPATPGDALTTRDDDAGEVA
jgi:hypothetical protein